MVLLNQNGRSARAVVHVDLDGARHIYRVHGWRWTESSDRLFETGLRGALDFCDEQGIVATFFAIAEDLDDPVKRRLLGDIVARGHELGSHSITHHRLSTLSEPDRRREVRESRLRLEQALGVPVAGFRAPAFDCDPIVADEIGRAGYRYDSSLIADGVTPGGQAVARSPFALAPAGPFELPLPSRRGLPLPFHPSYSLLVGPWYFRFGLRRAARTTPVFVLLFHLTDFAEPLAPAVLRPFASRWFTLSHLSVPTKRARCAEMVAELRRYYEIVPTDTLLDSAGKATFTGMNS